MSLDVGYLKTAFTNTITNNYVNFNGRTSRFSFWHWILAYLIFGIIVAVLTSFLGGVGEKISGLISLALFLPALGIDVRRLHDIDRSGWWMLLVLIPVVGFIVLLVFFAKAGTPGPNRFGDVPPVKAG